MPSKAPAFDVLYRGFDGLDVSFAGQIGGELCSALETAKDRAQETHQPAPLEWNGVRMVVFESGSRGGYAFMASTGAFGATWFFKKPSARDPWGIRVSCNSYNLASQGLGGARAELYSTLHALGLDPPIGAERIGRVDYAIDFLAPKLILEPQCFVMHSNAKRSDHIEQSEIAVAGNSGRVTSITVGKMPGRQVIVYDKRAEVIAKGKVGWWVIWDAERERAGLAELNRESAEKSRVWRVELRAGKSHLKDRWGIRTWVDLDNRFGDMISATLAAIRYSVPSGDSNRARWPSHELWNRVSTETAADLFEMRMWAEPDLVKSVEQDSHDRLLARQMVGLLTTRAALSGLEVVDLPAFALKVGKEMRSHIRQAYPQFARKIETPRPGIGLACLANDRSKLKK